ncbi:CamS family sex pheromone protein [Sediminibacillus massiliensis]|uniref:CamS family sex pheromone protein n=1 Tax=Sediminibacillus massiliensis TaxID=1926277 RepID=UPI0009884559|nr:CamS family sex pheromone protein [Sediminibacillus massiliensis]
MKKIGMMGLCILLFTAGCAPSFDNGEEVIEESGSQDETNQETAIIPSYNIDEEEYKVILPYKLSEARGVIVGQIANRLDIDEFEEGLRRHAKDTFDPDQYYFQEGQYLDEDIIYDWLGRDESTEEKEEDEESEVDDSGLNPAIEDAEGKETEEKIEDERNNPRYLSHILEHNFLRKESEDVVELGGISIGLAMKSNYRFQTEIGGPYYYEEISQSEMLKQGKQIAQEVLDRLRSMEDVPDVPIMIALYREEDRGALVPGNFVAKTSVSANGTTIEDWKTIDEENILFPSDEAEEKYPDDNDRVEYFERDVAKYFPNYVSVIGNGYYEDGQLKKMKLEIPIEFKGKAEVVGFTQYVYGLVMETFETYHALEINITSNNKQESLITRDPGQEEPEVHIYE